MNGKTVETVTEWDSEPFTGGYAGLHDLVAREFTGAVTDGTAWLFVLNGRVVGAVDGGVESFADADGTAYAAPDPSLPLLFAMRETGGEIRGRYYTDDTPLSEVDETLAEGNFTGYVALSENVLSGDYYVVYHGGRSLACAFVGASRRTVTGDEAFERAADEVGIYEVREVDVSVLDLPDPSATADADPADTPPVEGTAADDPESDADESDTDAELRSVEAGEGRTGTTTAGDGHDDIDPVGALTPDADDRGDEHGAGPAVDDGTGAAADPFSAEAAWRETRVIPSLDPADARPAPPEADGADAATDDPDGTDGAAVGPEPAPDPDGDPDREPDSDPESDSDPGSDDARERLETAREELATSRAAAERAREENAELRDRVESLEAELAAAREELDSVRAELETAREGASDGAAEAVPADRALAGTNLFVRYDSASEPTLDDVHGGAAAEAVNANLRIERHADFDAADATVGGRPFDEFLADTVEYGFVEWVVRELPYEIRETRSQSSMRRLFAALPEVDRAELRGTVEVTDETGDRVGERSFDVVLRDGMGAPLAAADVTDSREPTTEAMVDGLVEGASAVAERRDEFAAAFQVTASFFEPGALEATADATRGGLLSRGKHKSFVRLSRKRGFHLCLVEGRSGEYNLSVPEL